MCVLLHFGATFLGSSLLQSVAFQLGWSAECFYSWAASAYVTFSYSMQASLQGGGFQVSSNLIPIRPESKVNGPKAIGSYLKVL